MARRMARHGQPSSALNGSDCPFAPHVSAR
jgi:hypothetical protein